MESLTANCTAKVSREKRIQIAMKAYVKKCDYANNMTGARLTGLIPQIDASTFAILPSSLETRCNSRTGRSSGSNASGSLLDLQMKMSWPALATDQTPNRQVRLRASFSQTAAAAAAAPAPA
mmetsp:Transcript_5437/g.17430  ORF Transcript_5437/g.17430 Transcript_5437/m.17430 type:complete len:122 (-) Transcript_5437:752-1117(-)